MNLIKNTEIFVKNELLMNDGSHDWFHIDRVRKNALSLAKEEGIKDSTTLLVIEIAALLHDVKDWKYRLPATNSDPTSTLSESDSPSEVISSFLKNEGHEDIIPRVLFIIENIGYKTELGSSRTLEITPEFAIVQDADRLDAIGAIGIGRAFTFGGARNQPMYDPSLGGRSEEHPEAKISQEQYVKNYKNKQPTLNHFYDKLLHLKNLMKSSAGRRRAEKRHEFMELFLKEWYLEADGTK